MNMMLGSVVGSLFATCGMLIYFDILWRMKFVSFDSVQAIGSFFTGKEAGSYRLGVFIHIVLGLLFGALYTFAFALVPIPAMVKDMHFVYVVLGLGLGFNHGMLSALVIAVLFTQYHPLAKYKRVGFSIAVYYAMANIIYGFFVGLFFKSFSF